MSLPATAALVVLAPSLLGASLSLQSMALAERFCSEVLAPTVSGLAKVAVVLFALVAVSSPFSPLSSSPVLF